MKKLILGTLLLAIAGCSSTPTPDAAPESDEMIAAKKKAGYECKREKVTGSRVSHKVCTTQAQRDERREQDQEALRRMGVGSGVSSSGGN